MKTEKINLRFNALVLIIMLSAFSRLIPHMANFSPLGAISLFGAAYFTKKWQAFIIPISATWLSDMFINNLVYDHYYQKFTWFYEGFYWQYGSYLLITLIGILIFKKINSKRVFMGALSSSTIFFLISNFGCWIGSTNYGHNFGGLMNCYAAGIPFLKGTLFGDLFYSCAMFGLFALAQKQIPILSIEKQNT